MAHAEVSSGRTWDSTPSSRTRRSMTLPYWAPASRMATRSPPWPRWGFPGLAVAAAGLIVIWKGEKPDQIRLLDEHEHNVSLKREPVESYEDESGWPTQYLQPSPRWCNSSYNTQLIPIATTEMSQQQRSQRLHNLKHLKMFSIFGQTLLENLKDINMAFSKSKV